MSGLQAARSLQNTGEPSPDVLFSRRPSIKGTTTSVLPQKVSTKPTVSKNNKPQQVKLSKSKTKTKPTPTPTIPTKSNKTDKSIKTTIPSLPEASQPQSPRSPATSCTCKCTCRTCSGTTAAVTKTTTNNIKTNIKTPATNQHLLELQKVRAELLKTQQTNTLLLEKNKDLTTLGEIARKTTASAKKELEEASVTWRDRERELIAAGTSTLKREKESEEQCQLILQQLKECQSKLLHLERQNIEQEEGKTTANQLEQENQTKLIAVHMAEKEELQLRISELENKLTELMQSLESVRSKLETTEKESSETTATLVSAAWTDAEEQIKKEKETRLEMEKDLEGLKLLMKTQDDEMILLKKQLETSEQLPEQLRNLLNSKTEKEMKEEERTTAEIKQLKSEIVSLNENKEEITKEKDQLMERIAGMQNQVRNMTMKAKNMKPDEFEDTFEAVMREEFDAMRSAYEDKLKTLKDNTTKMKYQVEKEIREMEKAGRSRLIGLKQDVKRKDAQIRVLLKNSTE